MSQYYLQMNHISKSFPGVQALDDVSIQVDEGEIVALLGENGAGKSTLMNVLGGVIAADNGELFIDGTEREIKSVADATKLGIVFIHQELSLFKQLTVQENLFIDNFPRKGKSIFIDKKFMRRETNRIMGELGMDIPPGVKISALTLGQQQIVEIAAAMLKEAKIIILDEPSTSLTSKERDKLYAIMKQFREQKKVIIYITHDIDNALEISDRIYVLRDGVNSATARAGEVTKENVIEMMVGSKVGKQFLKSEKDLTDEVVLEVRDVCVEGKLDHVNLSLKKGEVLGLYGLIGSGRTELVNALYGFEKVTKGELFLKGEKIPHFDPSVMKAHGVGYLTENRRDEGLFLELGIDQNITITDLSQIQSSALRTIDYKKNLDVTERMIKLLKISTPGPYQFAAKLSGGNQQKVVIGKWMLLNPDIFILDEPTRGIDVGAKNEIYLLIDELARSGVSVLLISSEIEEILGLSDRVIVMSRGKTAAELEAGDINKAEIIKYTMS